MLKESESFHKYSNRTGIVFNLTMPTPNLGLPFDTTVQVYGPNKNLSDMILSVAGAGL